MLTSSSLKRAAYMVLAAVIVLVTCQVLGLIGQKHYKGALPIPVGVMLQALAFGCMNALLAIGIVLIYRANRIINFAHAGFGGVAAILFFELTCIRWFGSTVVYLTFFTNLANAAQSGDLFINASGTTALVTTTSETWTWSESVTETTRAAAKPNGTSKRFMGSCSLRGRASSGAAV